MFCQAFFATERERQSRFGRTMGNRDLNTSVILLLTTVILTTVFVRTTGCDLNPLTDGQGCVDPTSCVVERSVQGFIK